MGIYVHKCLYCGKQFEDYFENAKFCSKNCYHNYRRENGKLKTIKCPVCGTLFRQKYTKQIFCSVECRVKSTEDKIEYLCDFCGKSFLRTRSEVEKNHKHYCSNECKRNGMYWSIGDTMILRENFGKLSYKEMIDLFSTPKTVDEIKRRAIYIGLTDSRKWTKNEIEILVQNYSTVPIQDLMLLLPKRSLSSIRRQATTQGLKSFYYLHRKYTIEDEDYLKENYLSKNDEELGETLGRSSSAIAQHLWAMGLYRPSQPNLDCYKDLYTYIRSRLVSLRDRIKANNNYTCELTGCRSNIIVHHIYGFNLIFNEAIYNLNFPLYDNMSEYSQLELDKFLDEILSIQEYYKLYICITEDVHNQFHHIYGYGNNTEEQWNEFINTYYKQ